MTKDADSATPWREASFAVVDLETTGLDPERDEIISFASVPVEAGRVRPGDVRYRLVRPRRMPSGETIRIHGLRDSDLAGAAPLPEELPGLLDAISGRTVVAHVAAVEAGFLRAALEPLGVAPPGPLVDTAALALRLRRLRGQRPQAHAVGLSELARSLSLPVHRPHHADGDALTTAQAFIALASHLEAFEKVTVGYLLGLPSPAARREGVLRRAARSLRRG